MTETSTDRARVRQRTAEDLPDAAAALVAVHRRDGYPVEGVDDPTAWLDTAHQLRAWVAELNGRVVGHVAVSEPQPDDAAAAAWASSPDGAGERVAVLGRLFILPEARGHALGELLVHAATEYGRELGRRLVLDVMTKDAAAIRLYERLGWARTGVTTHDDGHGHRIPAVCYVGPAV